MGALIQKLFKLKENGTTIKTEIVAGITTFMTMAYILALGPAMLSGTGMDPVAVMFATSIASAIGCFIMAGIANYPFALAPGIGSVAYFATVCTTMNLDWKVALFIIFAEGLIFIAMSLTNVRESIVNAIPDSLKKGIAVGIGLFVAFIGLQDAGIIVSSPSLVALVNFKENFSEQGIVALLAIVGVIVIVILSVKKIKGAILIGIVITWMLGIVCQIAGIYKGASVIPVWQTYDVSVIGETFAQCFNADFSSVNITDFIVIMLSFLYVDMFDTLGTVIGVSNKANMLDENGKLPRMKQALLADAVATSAGAVLGVPTITTFVESSSGVAEGGRTGFSSVITGLLFVLAMFFSSLFIAIPGFAIAPALIYVGFLMASAVLNIDFNDLTESVPAYLSFIFMPLTYSICDGIAIGVVAYVLINLFTGKHKKITPVMYILVVMFLAKYCFL